jgi:hypothetical protein
MQPLRNKGGGSVDEDLGGVPCNDAMGLSLSGSGCGGDFAHDVFDKMASSLEVNRQDIASLGSGGGFVVVIPEFHSGFLEVLYLLLSPWLPPKTGLYPVFFSSHLAHALFTDADRQR